MDRPRVLTLTALIVAAAAFTGCGGGGSDGGGTGTGATQAEFTDDRDGLVKPEPATDAANRNPRGASVDYNDPPPPIAAAVTAAADTAGCTVKGFPSEAEPQSHIQGESATTQSLPPLSGAHNQRWADYGVYNKPVPYKYQLHSLEHGGVIVHYGRDVPVEGVNAIREMWAKSPAYVIVVPDTAPTFPANGVVVGSQQRWLVCKPFTPNQIAAVEAFIKEYRGRGPEQIPALNSGQDAPSDLPSPVIADTGAKG